MMVKNVYILGNIMVKIMMIVSQSLHLMENMMEMYSGV